MNFKDECLKMWEYLSERGGGKWEYYKARGIKARSTSMCAACEYVQEKEVPSSEACTLCPVQWIEKQEELNINFCLEEGSPYEEWERKPTKENAQKVYEHIKKTWNGEDV